MKVPLASLALPYFNHKHHKPRPTFWIAGEPFGQKYTYLQFVTNHSHLTVNKNQPARLYCLLLFNDARLEQLGCLDCDLSNFF